VFWSLRTAWVSDMFAFLLQEWLTIQSATSGAITQGEAGWLDLSDFLDVVVFLETKQVSASSGAMGMSYQTSPTKDAVLFQNMYDPTTVAMAVGVTTTVLLRDTALCPLARWLRWQILPTSGGTSYQATFRIWVAANQPGGSASASAQMGYGDSRGAGGGPEWTQGPPVEGFHGGLPGTAPWSPIVSNLEKQYRGVVLGKAGPGSIKYGQGPAPSPHWHWWDNVNVKKKPNDWAGRIRHVPIPSARSIVPFVAPGVKVIKR